MSDKTREALAGMLAIVDESRGVDGYHLNGDTAEWDEFPEVEAARAALAQQPALAAAVPDGWQLVPVEPSIAMEYAGCKAASRLMGFSEANRVYRAMLAAAPAAPVAQEPVAWVLMHNGDVAYDRDEVIICNVPGDCLDESYEWRAVYAAPPAAEQPECSGCRGLAAEITALRSGKEYCGACPDGCASCRVCEDSPPVDAAEQPDTVKVPRELLERGVNGTAEESLRAVRELRALLGKEGA